MRIGIFQKPFFRSTLLHALFVLLALFFMKNAPDFSKKADQAVEVTLTEAPAPEKDVQKKLEDKPSQKIVQRSEGVETEVAKKDAYLSDKTRVVEMEKAARNSGELVDAQKASSVPEKPVAKNKPDVKLSDLGLKIVKKETVKYEQARNWVNHQQGETIKGGEYIQGMKEGEVSALNTKEFVFFSYYNRIRKQLDQAWQPILKENISHIVQTGRHLAAKTDFVTRTLVTLNGKGEIVKVSLLEESGTHDLDQAAVDALNKAGPYPNPPKGLISQAGTLEFRWDFILKT